LYRLGIACAFRNPFAEKSAFDGGRSYEKGEEGKNTRSTTKSSLFSITGWSPCGKKLQEQNYDEKEGKKGVLRRGRTDAKKKD